MIAFEIKDKAGTAVAKTDSICYCKAACVISHGAQAWATAGHTWTKDKRNEGCTIVGNPQDSFWKAVYSVDNAKEVFTGKGWKLSDDHATIAAVLTDS